MSMMQLTHPKVTQPKPGGLSASSLSWAIDRPAQMPDSSLNSQWKCPSIISNSNIFKILLQFTWRKFKGPLTWSLNKPHQNIGHAPPVGHATHVGNYIYIYMHKAISIIYVWIYLTCHQVRFYMKSFYSRKVDAWNKTSMWWWTYIYIYIYIYIYTHVCVFLPHPGKFSVVPNCLNFFMMDCTIDLVIGNQTEIVL